MKKRDLIELLSSTIESDAIIARLFNLFHKTYGYSLELLDTIIFLGIKKGIFEIGDLNDYNKTYDYIDWREDNVQQEVFMKNPEVYIKQLFTENPTVPKDFEQFIID